MPSHYGAGLHQPSQTPPKRRGNVGPAIDHFGVTGGLGAAGHRIAGSFFGQGGYEQTQGEYLQAHQLNAKISAEAASVNPMVRAALRAHPGSLGSRDGRGRGQGTNLQVLGALSPEARRKLLSDVGWTDEQIGALEHQHWGAPPPQGANDSKPWYKTAWDLSKSITGFGTDYAKYNPADVKWQDVKDRVRGFGQGALEVQQETVDSVFGQFGKDTYAAPEPETEAQQYGQTFGRVSSHFLYPGNVRDLEPWEIGVEAVAAIPLVGATTRGGARLIKAGANAAGSGLDAANDLRAGAQRGLHNRFGAIPEPKTTRTEPLRFREAAAGEEVIDTRFLGKVPDDARAGLFEMQQTKKVGENLTPVQKFTAMLDNAVRLPRDMVEAAKIHARGEQVTAQRGRLKSVLYPGETTARSLKETADALLSKVSGRGPIYAAQSADVKRALTEAGPVKQLLGEGVQALEQASMRFIGAGGHEVSQRWKKLWSGMRGQLPDASIRKARRLQRAMDNALGSEEGKGLNPESIKELDTAWQKALGDDAIDAALRQKVGRSQRVQQNFNEAKSLSKFLSESAQATFDQSVRPAASQLRNLQATIPTRTPAAVRKNLEAVTTVLDETDEVLGTVTDQARAFGEVNARVTDELAKIDETIKRLGGMRKLPDDLRVRAETRRNALKGERVAAREAFTQARQALNDARTKLRSEATRVLNDLKGSKLSQAVKDRISEITQPFTGPLRLTSDVLARGARRTSELARRELPADSVGGEIGELMSRLNDTPKEFYQFQKLIADFGSEAGMTRAMKSALSRALAPSNTVKLVLDKFQETIHAPNEALFAFADEAMGVLGPGAKSATRPSEFFTGPAREFPGQVLTGALKFEARDGVFARDELANMLKMVRDHPKLAGSVEQQGETVAALLAAHRFAKLSRKEVGQLAEVFGDDMGRSLLKLEKLDSKSFEAFSYFFNAPKSIMAVMDMSGLLRQGLLVSAGQPHRLPERIMFSLRAMADEDYAGAVLKDIQSHPKYSEWRAMGGEPVDFSRSGRSAGLVETEEIYVNNLAHDIPIFGDKISRPSERSYAALLSKMRFEMYTNQVKAWEEPTESLLSHMPGLGKYFKAPKAASVGTDPQRYRDLNAFVNAATGKSNLLDFMRSGVADRVLNLAFWAPRLALSRFEVPLQLLVTSNGGVGFRSTSWAVRRVVAKELAKSSLTIGSVLTALKYGGEHLGVNVSANPFNSDFGRIRYQGYQPSAEDKDARAREMYPEFDGFLDLSEPRKEDVLRELGASDTQVVLDPLGGFSQPIRLVAQMATGRQDALGSGASFDIARLGPLQRYLRSKLSPVAGTLTTIGTGTTTGGEEVEAIDELSELLVPLFAQEVKELVEESGVAGGVVSLGPALGVGAQAFTTPGLERERLAQQLFNKPFDTLDHSAQQQIRGHLDVAESRAGRKPSESDEMRKMVNSQAEERKEAAGEALFQANGFGNSRLTQTYRDSRVKTESRRAIELGLLELQRNPDKDEIDIPPIEEQPENYAYFTWLSFYTKPVGQGGVMKTDETVDFDELNRLTDQLYAEIDARHTMFGGPSVTDIRGIIHDRADLTPLTLDDEGNPSSIDRSYDGLRDWRHTARWYSWEKSDYLETDLTEIMRVRTGNPDLQYGSFWDEDLSEAHQQEYETFVPIFRRGGRSALRQELPKLGFKPADIDVIGDNIEYINKQFEKEKQAVLRMVPELNLVSYQFYASPLLSTTAQAMGWAIERELGNNFWGILGKVFLQPGQNERINEGVLSALVSYDNGSIQSLEDLANVNPRDLERLRGISRTAANGLVTQARELLEELEAQRDARN